MLLKIFLAVWPMQSRWLYLRRIHPNLVNLVREHLGKVWVLLQRGIYWWMSLVLGDSFICADLILIPVFPAVAWILPNSFKPPLRIALSVCSHVATHIPGSVGVGHHDCWQWCQGSSLMRQRRWRRATAWNPTQKCLLPYKDSRHEGNQMLHRWRRSTDYS